jgi:hypothetical protein
MDTNDPPNAPADELTLAPHIQKQTRAVASAPQYEKAATGTAKRSPRTIIALLASGLLFGAGYFAGVDAGEHMLNWSGARDGWYESKTDRYELAIGRPANAVGPAAADVNKSALISIGHSDAEPLNADVRLAPYLFSSIQEEEGLGEPNVRTSLSRRQPYHTNLWGEVAISGERPPQGLGSLRDVFVPPVMGATFMLGDGRNTAGGFTFYELRVHRGRIWSTGSLIRFDCAASALYDWCKQHKLEHALVVGPVQPLIPHLGHPVGDGMGDLDPSGTLVQAWIMLTDS